MNLDLVWNDVDGSGDWRVTGGRLQTGNLLVSAALISLFTDRVAQPDYPDPDRHGWWEDTFDGINIGSRLWQLRRRKIADRPKLILEATDICTEALQWMVDSSIAQSVDVAVTSPRAGIGPVSAGSAGSLLLFTVQIAQPVGDVPLIRALWKAV